MALPDGLLRNHDLTAGKTSNVTREETDVAVRQSHHTRGAVHLAEALEADWRLRHALGSRYRPVEAFSPDMTDHKNRLRMIATHQIHIRLPKEEPEKEKIIHRLTLRAVVAMRHLMGREIQEPEVEAEVTQTGTPLVATRETTSVRFRLDFRIDPGGYRMILERKE